MNVIDLQHLLKTKRIHSTSNECTIWFVPSLDKTQKNQTNSQVAEMVLCFDIYRRGSSQPLAPIRTGSVNELGKESFRWRSTQAERSCLARAPTTSLLDSGAKLCSFVFIRMLCTLPIHPIVVHLFAPKVGKSSLYFKNNGKNTRNQAVEWGQSL